MAEEAKPVEVPTIPYEYFQKLDLRTAQIVSAEAHPNADRLLVLQIRVGEKTKQIVAGIKEFYSVDPSGLKPMPPSIERALDNAGVPIDDDERDNRPCIVGKTIIIVDNLQPAEVRGVKSEGMLLAVKTPEMGILRLLTTDGPAQPGLKVT